MGEVASRKVPIVVAQFQLDEAAASVPAPAGSPVDQGTTQPDENAVRTTDDPKSQPRLLQQWLEDGCLELEADRCGFAVSGWLEQGFTWNPDSPRNRINGPVTYNDRANEYQLNQFGLQFDREVDTKSEGWDVGGHLQLIYGTDGRSNVSNGLEDKINGGSRFYQLAIPKLNLEFFVPVGNGLRVLVGHFYTIIGHESTLPQLDFCHVSSVVARLK